MRTTVIGSYPFPGWLEFACQHLDEFGVADRSELQNDAVIAAIHDQVSAGLDVITDGEQTWLDFPRISSGMPLRSSRAVYDVFNIGLLFGVRPGGHSVKAGFSDFRPTDSLQASASVTGNCSLLAPRSLPELSRKQPSLNSAHGK